MQISRKFLAFFIVLFSVSLAGDGIASGRASKGKEEDDGRARERSRSIVAADREEAIDYSEAADGYKRQINHLTDESLIREAIASRHTLQVITPEYDRRWGLGFLTYSLNWSKWYYHTAKRLHFARNIGDGVVMILSTVLAVVVGTDDPVKIALAATVAGLTAINTTMANLGDKAEASGRDRKRELVTGMQEVNVEYFEMVEELKRRGIVKSEADLALFHNNGTRKAFIPYDEMHAEEEGDYIIEMTPQRRGHNSNVAATPMESQWHKNSALLGEDDEEGDNE
ncbi:MAG: hypothetical protein ACPGXY_01730 [Alphaproteobacteria bacterium]